MLKNSSIILVVLSIFSLKCHASIPEIENFFYQNFEENGQTTQVPHYTRIVGAEEFHLNNWRGQGIKIGVIDTGSYKEGSHKNVTIINQHDTESNKVSISIDSLDEDNNHAHLVVETLLNIAPQSQIYLDCYRDNKLLDDANNSNAYSKSLAQSINHLLDLKVSFLSISLGNTEEKEINITCDDCITAKKTVLSFWQGDEIKQALLKARDQGVPIFIAASNEGKILGHDVYPDVLDLLKEMDGYLYFVMASAYENKREYIPKFSNIPQDAQYVPYCFTAPGKNIMNTDINGKKILWKGTSASCPIVVGCATLLKQAYNLTSKQALQLLKDNPRRVCLNYLNLTFDEFYAENKTQYDQRTDDAKKFIGMSIKTRYPILKKKLPKEEQKKELKLQSEENGISVQNQIKAEYNRFKQLKPSNYIRQNEDFMKNINAIGIVDLTSAHNAAVKIRN